MEWTELIVDSVAKFIWPILIFVLALIFRRRIGEAIGNLSDLSGPGFKASFSQQIKQASLQAEFIDTDEVTDNKEAAEADKSDDANEPDEPRVGTDSFPKYEVQPIGPSREWVLDFLHREHMRALDAPLSAIAITWYTIEQEFNRLTDSIGDNKVWFSSVGIQIQFLVQRSVIPRSLGELLETLYEARTNAAHVSVIERSKAQDFVNSAGKALLMLSIIPTPFSEPG